MPCKRPQTTRMADEQNDNWEKLGRRLRLYLQTHMRRLTSDMVGKARTAVDKINHRIRTSTKIRSAGQVLSVRIYQKRNVSTISQRKDGHVFLRHCIWQFSSNHNQLMFFTSWQRLITIIGLMALEGLGLTSRISPNTLDVHYFDNYSLGFSSSLSLTFFKHICGFCSSGLWWFTPLLQS